MKLILSFVMSLFFAVTLSANCGKCDMKGMQEKSEKSCCMMKKMKKDGSCGQGKCGQAMKKGSCGEGKCGQAMKKASCGEGKCGNSMKKSCKMEKKNCNKENCENKQMKNKHCDIDAKKAKCDCKNGGECKCKGNCKCGVKQEKKDAKQCGCGMTVEDCKKMMPYCEFRDGKKEDK